MVAMLKYFFQEGTQCSLHHSGTQCPPPRPPLHRLCSRYACNAIQPKLNFSQVGGQLSLLPPSPIPARFLRSLAFGTVYLRVEDGNAISRLLRSADRGDIYSDACHHPSLSFAVCSPDVSVDSPVFRTPSFNSSGRSSNCDGEDMYSDISIEDDVSDLNQKVSKSYTFLCN